MHNKIKTPKEISNIRRSGSILEHVIQFVVQYTKPGMSTKDLADLSLSKLNEHQHAKPVFLNYHGFPHVMCVSVNDQVIHGIPKPNKILHDGDVVSVDFGVNYKGMITDAARTFVVGNTNSSKRLLLEKNEQALLSGISVVKNTVRVGTISSAIQNVLDDAKLGIVREYVGHGVGHKLHENPNIPNYGIKNTGPELLSGMTIAIEPMAMLGNEKVYVENDGWTVSTSDGSLSAHFEDTVLVTDDGFEILTRSTE